MSLTVKTTVLAVCAMAFLAPPAAATREPTLDIKAEWITPACEFPARFRVTLRNTGDEAFAIPAETTLGRARPINFLAMLREGTFAYNGESRFSSESFFMPPYSPSALIDLAPGDSETFEMEFDGIFDAHGGERPTYEGRWRGRLAFYYYLPRRVVSHMPEHTPPILISGERVSAWSNALDCA